MGRALLTVALFVFFCGTVAAADEIALKDIWALDMAGTRDVRELDTPDHPIVDTVLSQISETRKHDHGFAVLGDGADAMREFLRVRTDHDHWNRLPADQPISLVFFTKPIREDLVIRSIERRGARFIPRFSFAPRDAAEPSPQLALVSLGKLPLGDYYVTPERMPAEQKHVDAGFKEPPPQKLRDVFMGCSFHVVDGAGGPPAAEKVVEIPIKTIWGYRIAGTQDLSVFRSPDTDEPLVGKVLLEIRHSWGHSEGMAVGGEGREALEDLHHKRVEMRERSEVSAEAPVSLAFYTRGIGWHIELEKVVRQGNIFAIQYRPIPNQAAMSDSHLALIPVGKLPPGKYRVNVAQLPMEAEYEDQGLRQPPRNLRERISDSFTFVVIKKRA